MMVFMALWVSVVYAPVAHWVWGGGFLAELCQDWESAAAQAVAAVAPAGPGGFGPAPGALEAKAAASAEPASAMDAEAYEGLLRRLGDHSFGAEATAERLAADIARLKELLQLVVPELGHFMWRDKPPEYQELARSMFDD